MALVVGLSVLDADTEELGLSMALVETRGEGELDVLALLLGDLDPEAEALTLEVGQLEMEPEGEEPGL